jgi:AcrR family transcriptional regulator
MRADAVAKRNALLTAARRVMAARGIDAPLSAVADGAGVGIATLYRHFPTRDDLLTAVVQDIRDEVVAIIERYRPLMRTDPESAWPDLVHSLVALQPGALIPQFAAHLSERGLAPHLADIRSTALAALDTVLRQARRAGLVRADVTATRFQLGLATITRPLPPVDLDVDDVERWLVEVFLRGLRPDGVTRR